MLCLRDLFTQYTFSSVNTTVFCFKRKIKAGPQKESTGKQNDKLLTFPTNSKQEEKMKTGLLAPIFAAIKIKSKSTSNNCGSK